MFCSLCGTPYEDDDAFCGGCGARFETAPVHMPQAQPEPEIRQPVHVPPAAAPAHARMLLVFLLDTSASAAPHIGRMFSCLNSFFKEINADSIAKNALDMVVIQFNDGIGVIDDLSGLSNPNVPEPAAQGAANYSAPIREALSIVEEYAAGQAQMYKPWVVMITSDAPGDDIADITAQVQNAQSAGKLRFMTLGVANYDSETLKKLTDVVFRQKGTDYTSFFQWIRESIKLIVRSSPNEKPQLPQLTGDVYRDK